MKTSKCPLQKTLLLLALCLGLCSCTAASAQPSLYDAEVQSVEAQAFFSLVLPADWEVYCDENAKFAAVSPDGNIGVQVIAEFGGYTFYSMEELGEQVRGTLELDDLSVSHVQEGLNSSKQYHQILSFKDGEGNDAVLDNYIYNPYTSVVYYLFLTVSASEYDVNSKLFSEIINSFELSLKQEEYYSMIQELPAPGSEEEEGETGTEENGEEHDGEETNGDGAAQ